MKRILALASALVLAVASSPVAASATTPRLPTSAADWATFTASQKAAVMQFEWDLLQTSLKNGTADVHSVGRAASGALVQADGADALTITYDYNCPIQWVDQIGGAWFRGGGYTDTSSNVYYITASRVNLKGQFLRDGVLSGNWYNERYSASHAESWSGWSYRFMWESIHWTNKGWHTIRPTSGGSYLLGPDQYCYVSITR